MAFDEHFTSPMRQLKQRYEIPERKLGQIFGALFVELESIYASWKTFSVSGNKLLDLGVIRDRCSRDAALAGALYEGLVFSLAAELTRLEVDYKQKAKEFARLAYQLATQSGGGSFVCQYSGPVYAVSTERLSWKQITFGFHTHDGIEPITGSLGELFSGENGRAALLKLAKQVFGDAVQLGQDPYYRSCLILPEPPCCLT